MAKTKTPKPDPSVTYVAWETAYIAPVDAVIRAGTKLRGDHPAVVHSSWLFLPAESSDDELADRRNRYMAQVLGDVAPSARHEPDRARVPEPAPDEEIVVATRGTSLTAGGGRTAGPNGEALSVSAGTRLHKNHPAVRADSDAFVPVTNGIPRNRAVVAQQRVSNQDGDGNVRTIHAGQWADEADPLVQINPHAFERVGFR